MHARLPGKMLGSICKNVNIIHIIIILYMHNIISKSFLFRLASIRLSSEWYKYYYVKLSPDINRVINAIVVESREHIIIIIYSSITEMDLFD
jgi:hypothetical protein